MSVIYVPLSILFFGIGVLVLIYLTSLLPSAKRFYENFDAYEHEDSVSLPRTIGEAHLESIQFAALNTEIENLKQRVRLLEDLLDTKIHHSYPSSSLSRGHETQAAYQRDVVNERSRSNVVWNETTNSLKGYIFLNANPVEFPRVRQANDIHRSKLMEPLETEFEWIDE